MSPLKEGNIVHSDDLKKPLNWWTKVLGLSTPTIAAAARATNVRARRRGPTAVPQQAVGRAFAGSFAPLSSASPNLA